MLNDNDDDYNNGKDKDKPAVGAGDCCEVPMDCLLHVARHKPLQITIIITVVIVIIIIIIVIVIIVRSKQNGLLMQLREH